MPKFTPRALALLLAASLLVPLALSTAPSAMAAEVQILRQNSREAFLAGDLEGLALDDRGRLVLAERIVREHGVDEPFLFTAAVHPRGWVVGTGPDGKVLLIDRDGGVEELLDAAEANVFALHVDEDGTVFAGASPGGAVYRVAPGESADPDPTPWATTDATYVWALARGADGTLLAATGTEGELLALAEDGSVSTLWDGDDVHLRSLVVADDGRLLIGTAGEGLVLEVAADGSSVRTLHDAAQTEIVALAPAPDGRLFVAAIASEASSVDLGQEAGDGSGGPSSGASGGPGSDNGASGGQVTVTSGPTSVGSRPASFSGDRSQVLRIEPSGITEPVWNADDETVFDLLWHRDRLWIATGLEGALQVWDGEEALLAGTLEDKQLVALLPDDPGPAIATTNAAGLWRLSGERERRGRFTSAVFDAGQVARFGTLRWRGETPPGTAVRFAARSGLAAQPDRTWSGWVDADAPSPTGEVSLAAVPSGRYVQWRAEVTGTDASPRLAAVELSYRQLNTRPAVTALEVLEPGQITVPAGFNPLNEAYEPAHPTRDGIFTTVEKVDAQRDPRTKTLWKKGFRSLTWSAEDPNGDPLRYRLSARPDDGDGGEDAWIPMADDLEDTYWSFDATVLPDGLYRFRVEASDALANPGEGGLVAERVSDPVIVDHRPPQVVAVERDGGDLLVTVEDAWNPVTTVEWSVDASPWEPVAARDGLLDGRRETVRVPVPDGASMALLRLMDAAYNGVTVDLLAAEANGAAANGVGR